MSDLELAFANYEDMIRRQACGDRSKQAVAKARAKLIATLSHPDTQAGALLAVEWPDSGELEAWRSTADDLLRSLPNLRGPEIRRAAHLLQNAYMFASKGALAATQPNAAPGDGATLDHLLKVAQIDVNAVRADGKPLTRAERFASGFSGNHEGLTAEWRITFNTDYGMHESEDDLCAAILAAVRARHGGKA